MCTAIPSAVDLVGRWACAVGGQHGDPPSPVSAFPRAEQGEDPNGQPCWRCSSSASSSRTRASAVSARARSWGEGGNVLPGLGVVPAQISVLPPDEEIERGAVALQDPFLDRLDWDGLVLVVYQPVSGEHCPVELSGFVEPPVLGGT